MQSGAEASKRVIKKTAETTGGLIGNIADAVAKSYENKITKTASKNVSSTSISNENATKNSLEIPKEIHIPSKKKQLIDELRLI